MADKPHEGFRFVAVPNGLGGYSLLQKPTSSAASVPPPEPPTLNDERIPPSLEALDEAIDKAQAELSALCSGKRFLMSIPARPDTDSDLVIGTALAFAKHHVAALRAELAAAKAVIEAARQMPRDTPAPGGTSTVHQFRLSAADVWALDRALTAYDRAARAASGEDV